MRSDYCPVANEPCQCRCLDGCRIKNNSRKPLTDEEIIMLTADTWGNASIAPQLAPAFARAIERAHGIGGEE